MFLQLYNVFGLENSKFHMSMEELYIYSLLKRRVDFNNVTVLTVDLLSQLSTKYHGIKIHSKKSEARKRIKSQLVSLQEIGVIKIDGDYSKYDELLEVSFVDVKDSGHAQIDYRVFDNIKDMSDLYIHYVVACFNNKNNKFKVPFNCTDERWARILNVKSVTTVRGYIEQAISSGLIHKNSGDYNKERARKGQNGQDINQYKIIPFTEEEKSNIQKKKEKESQTDESNKYNFPTGNWLNNNNLDVDDYIIYLEHKQKSDPISKDFIADCENKINRIMKGNPKFSYFHNQFTEKAEEKIRERKQKFEQDKKEHQQQVLMEKIKNGQVIVDRDKHNPDDPMEFERIYLDNINQIQLDDLLYYVKNDELDTILISNLITGTDRQSMLYDYYYYSDDVKEELLNEFKEIIRVQGKIELNDIKEEMDKIRKEVANSHNIDRSYDEDWEGDRWHDDVDEIPYNQDLQKRIREHNEVLNG